MAVREYRKRHRWTQEEEKWLLDNHDRLAPSGKLTATFNSTFHTNLTVCSIFRKWENLKNNVPTAFRYTDEMIKWLTENRSKYKMKDLTIKFNQVFGTNKSRYALRVATSELGIRLEDTHQWTRKSIGATLESGYHYLVKTNDDFGDIHWVCIPKDVYENDKEVSNCALAYGLAKELDKSIKEVK